MYLTLDPLLDWKTWLKKKKKKNWKKSDEIETSQSAFLWCMLFETQVSNPQSPSVPVIEESWMFD